MAYYSYQVLQSEVDESKTRLTLLALVTQEVVNAEIRHEYDSFLLKFCGEERFYIIHGYCSADCIIDDTYSGNEAIVIGKEGIHNHMSKVCRPITPKTTIVPHMYLCVER